MPCPVQVQLIAHNRKREQIAQEQGIPTSRLSLRRPEGLMPGRRKRKSPLMVSLSKSCCREALDRESGASYEDTFSHAQVMCLLCNSATHQGREICTVVLLRSRVCLHIAAWSVPRQVVAP